MSQIIKDHIALKEISRDVDSVEEAKVIISKLEDTLRKHDNGYGLSAIQIGIPKRVAVIKYGKHNKEFIHLVNSEFVEKGDEFTFSGEGCLSFPGVFVDTIRHVDFTIENDVINEETQTFKKERLYFWYPNEDEAHKVESIAVEHEMEHWNGKTILDYGKPIEKLVPIVNDIKVGRNQPCPCGSGKKYKKCCLDSVIPNNVKKSAQIKVESVDVV